MPYPYSSATLGYQITAQPGVDPAAIAAKMEAAPLDLAAMVDLLGVTVTSDTTTVSGSTVTRTIVFALGQGFNSCLQPNAPLASASGFFQELYTAAISRWCVSQVTTLSPIVN